jgi:hypothetical protein
MFGTRDNSINVGSVLRRIGYGRDDQPSGRVVTLLDDYLENAHHLIAPEYAYVIRDIVNVSGNRVTFEGPVTVTSDVLARLLGNCEAVAVYAATIGGYLEETVDSLSGDRLMLQASVLDAIGSSAAERVAGLVEDRVRFTARIRGLEISRRFSPGYCDWDISDQAGLFQALRDEDLSITLTDSFLMLPRKSTSGIIGLGVGRAVSDYNPCRTCDRKSCNGRRK